MWVVNYSESFGNNWGMHMQESTCLPLHKSMSRLGLLNLSADDSTVTNMGKNHTSTSGSFHRVAFRQTTRLRYCIHFVLLGEPWFIMRINEWWGECYLIGTNCTLSVVNRRE